jgi:hypothetical protein
MTRFGCQWGPREAPSLFQKGPPTRSLAERYTVRWFEPLWPRGPGVLRVDLLGRRVARLLQGRARVREPLGERFPYQRDLGAAQQTHPVSDLVRQ